MIDTRLLLDVHAGTTLLMAGLCLFVQVVHYPLFAHVPAERFGAFSRRHQARTTLVVAPLMLLEAVSAVWLAATVNETGLRLEAWVGLGLLALVWGSTFGVQVPLHASLEKSYNEATVRKLVRTNWARTVVWVARGVLALWMIRAFSGGVG